MKDKLNTFVIAEVVFSEIFPENMSPHILISEEARRIVPIDNFNEFSEAGVLLFKNRWAKWMSLRPMRSTIVIAHNSLVRIECFAISWRKPEWCVSDDTNPTGFPPIARAQIYLIFIGEPYLDGKVRTPSAAILRPIT